MLGSDVGGESGRTSGATLVGGLIRPPYKIIVGDGPGNTLDMAGWPGPHSPNASSVNWSNVTAMCGVTPETGCLFDIFADPGEHINIAASQPAKFTAMLTEMQAVKVFSPIRGSKDAKACAAAYANGQGRVKAVWGPFVD